MSQKLTYKDAINQVRKMREEIRKPEIIQLHVQDPGGYEEHMKVMFPECDEQFHSLFEKTVSGDMTDVDIQKLEYMVTIIESVQSKDEAYNADVKMGEHLSDYYLGSLKQKLKKKP